MVLVDKPQLLTRVFLRQILAWINPEIFKIGRGRATKSCQLQLALCLCVFLYTYGLLLAFTRLYEFYNGYLFVLRLAL